MVFFKFWPENIKKVLITLQALRLKLNRLNQTGISSKLIMQITKTFSYNCVCSNSLPDISNRTEFNAAVSNNTPISLRRTTSGGRVYYYLVSNISRTEKKGVWSWQWTVDVTAHERKSSTARTNLETRIRADTPLRSWSGRAGPVSDL